MDDSYVIFPKENITVKELKRVAKRSNSKTATARKLGVSFTRFNDTVTEHGLLHIFNKPTTKSTKRNDDKALRIAAYLEKHKTITAAKIKSMFPYKIIPSEPIKILKSRGYQINAIGNDPDEGYVWQFRGKVRVIDRTNDYVEFEVENITVPCMSCKKRNVTFTVKKGEPYDKRRICNVCKERDEPVFGIGANGRLKGMTKVSRDTTNIKIKVYHPGDDDFYEIAKECTPIKDIPSRKERETPHY